MKVKEFIKYIEDMAWEESELIFEDPRGTELDPDVESDDTQVGERFTVVRLVGRDLA